MGLFNFFKKKEVDELGNVIGENSADELGNPINNIESNIDPTGLDGTASFKMVIEDIFTITGRGTVVTGVVEFGNLKIMDDIIIFTQDGKKIATKVAGIEQFRKIVDEAHEGEHIGLLLPRVYRSDVNKGDIIYKFIK